MGEELPVTVPKVTNTDLNIAPVGLAGALWVNVIFPAINDQPGIVVGALAHLQRLQIGEKSLSVSPQQILIDVNGCGWNHHKHA